MEAGAAGGVKEELLGGAPRQRVTFDDILGELGEFGREQKINYLLFSLPYVMSAMQVLQHTLHQSLLPTVQFLFSYWAGCLWELSWSTAAASRASHPTPPSSGRPAAARTGRRGSAASPT